MSPFTSSILTDIREFNKTDATIKAITGFIVRHAN